MIIYMLALYKLGSTLQDEDIVGGYISISSINFHTSLAASVSKKKKKKGRRSYFK
jgi:Kef-type K+ transport system membrane component KefB